MDNNGNAFIRKAENENLLRLLLKKQSIDERIYAVVREAMRSLSHSENIKREDFSHIFEECLDIVLPEADFPEYEKTICVNKKLLRLTACSVLDDVAPGKRKISDFFSDDRSIHSGGTVSYLKNTLSDKAYKQFLKYLDSAECTFAADFNSACEAVYDGKADYCILPIENSTDGRLGGFYNLISKYELFVCLSTDVMSNDGSVRTRFALCKKNTALFQHSKKDQTRYAELIVRTNADNTMGDVLFYADFFDVRTVKTDCAPSLYSDGEYDMYVTFAAEESKLVKLFLFFTLEQIRYSAVGIYTVI